jgi:hypothetical protein
MMRRLFGWAALALVLLYAISNPSSTAATLRHLVSGASRLAFALVGGGH